MDNLTRFAISYKKNNSLPLINLLGKDGNHKLPSTTATFNMTPAKSCPSKRLGLCKASLQGAKCYANKAEYFRPTVLPYRERQAKLWQKITAEEFASQFILYNATRIKKFNMLRFSESGDFPSQADVNKVEKIARTIRKYGVKTYTYTSRSDLDFSACKNLIINGSGFIKKGISNQVNIIKNLKDKPKGFGICPMNCRICKRCSTRGFRVVIKKH